MPAKIRGPRAVTRLRYPGSSPDVRAAHHLSRHQTCMWTAVPSTRASAAVHRLHYHISTLGSKLVSPPPASGSVAAPEALKPAWLPWGGGAELRQRSAQRRDLVADSVRCALPGPTPSCVLGRAQPQRSTRFARLPVSVRAPEYVRHQPAPEGWASGNRCCGAGTAATRKGANRSGCGTRTESPSPPEVR